MQKIIQIAFVIVMITSCSQDKTDNTENLSIEYPRTHRDTVVDSYHGKNIADPYRWLEDDHAEATKSWVKAQNAVTEEYLSKIPYRNLIRDRLESLWNYERYSTPFRRGDKYYFFKNDGLQNQSVLYVQETLDGDPSVVLDPNEFSEDGSVALGAISFNKSGDLLAYQISEGGSDWRTIFVKDLHSGQLLMDRIEWVKFSGISWAGDGFYYSRFPTPDTEDRLSGQNSFHKVFYHRLGTDQSADILIMEEPSEPQRNFYCSTTEDERFLCVSASESTSGNALYVKDLNQTTDFKTLVDAFDQDYRVIDNVGDRLFVMTNKDAPNWTLLACDLQDQALTWHTIIPEQQEVLSNVQLIGGKIFAEFLTDAKSVVKAYSYNGDFQEEIKLPGIGSMGPLSGEKDHNFAFYSFTNYTTPTSIYQFDSETLESKLFKKPEIDFDPSQFETVQRFYTSKDGTRIPMFITYKKGIVKNGKNPALLYGYGGFDISITPGFSVSNLILLENGGVYAVANIRGGGEYGKEWHQSGTKEKKQNVFDDFQAAAEFLIRERFTSPAKLAIMGGSNGGLLVGACMTQRPDLFKVAIPRVGVLDMLRYHEFTIGWAWAEDYGRSDDPEAFEYLIKYSPLHNIQKRAYPATFIMTADHDDRVVPAHSFKFAAELQNKQQGNNPTLIRIESSAGHGAGKPTSKLIDENTDMLSFMFYNMGENVTYKSLDQSK